MITFPPDGVLPIKAFRSLSEDSRGVLSLIGGSSKTMISTFVINVYKTNTFLDVAGSAFIHLDGQHSIRRKSDHITGRLVSATNGENSSKICLDYELFYYKISFAEMF
jgi:hypothetical protein